MQYASHKTTVFYLFFKVYIINKIIIRISIGFENTILNTNPSIDSISASINATPAKGKTARPIMENTAYNISPTSKITNKVAKNSPPSSTVESLKF